MTLLVCIFLCEPGGSNLRNFLWYWEFWSLTWESPPHFIRRSCAGRSALQHHSNKTWNTKIVVLGDRNLKSEFHRLIITEFVWCINRKRLWGNLNGCEQWFPIFLSSCIRSDLVQGAAVTVHPVLWRARHNFWLLVFTKNSTERLDSPLGWAIELCREPLEFTLGCHEPNLQMLGNNPIPLKVSTTALNHTRQRLDTVFFKLCPVLVVPRAVKAAVISYPRVKWQNICRYRIYILFRCTLLTKVTRKKRNHHKTMI